MKGVKGTKFKFLWLTKKEGRRLGKKKKQHTNQMKIRIKASKVWTEINFTGNTHT